MKNRSDLLLALQKIQDAQSRSFPKSQPEDSLLMKLITALDKMGSVTAFTGPKGDRGEMPIKGYDYFTPEEAKLFLDAATPQKGVHYFDGTDGENGTNGVDGEDGSDGVDGVANMDEVQGVIDECMGQHMKACNHALIHDSKMIGEYEVDVSTLTEGDFLQVKGKKLVGVKIKMPDMNGMRSYVASQGVSNVRSYPVTSSMQVDAMGIYVVDATAGNITITLPTAAGRENHWFEFIRIDGTANTVTLIPTGSETFSGMTDYIMQQWTDVKLFAYNSTYLIRSAS